MKELVFVLVLLVTGDREPLRYQIIKPPFPTMEKCLKAADTRKPAYTVDWRCVPTDDPNSVIIRFN